jgi:hypothetical protein
MVRFSLRSVFGRRNHATSTHAAAPRLATHAPVSQADQDDLPDSDFAYLERGGTHDKPGFTKPRSNRHLLVNDASHVHDAEARFDQTKFDSAAAKRGAWRKIQEAARKHGAKLRMELGSDGKLHEKKSAHAAAAERAGAPEWIERCAPAFRTDGCH